jgi:hypothetical protein
VANNNATNVGGGKQGGMASSAAQRGGLARTAADVDVDADVDADLAPLRGGERVTSRRFAVLYGSLKVHSFVVLVCVCVLCCVVLFVF